ncbi:MAG TPA: MarR family transcriptional regulator [Virgibacillus sp.]|nr:MarR family transcriptional regulator [Virgibacillus sp.]
MTTQMNNGIMNNVINSFAKTIEMFGLTPMEARLFAYLFIEDEPKTLDEMGAAIGMSKTSMSTNVRRLLDLNLVSRVWRKGVRKDLYQVNAPLYKIFMDAYQKKWIAAVSHQLSSLENIENNQSKNDHQLKGQNKASLNEIIDFHKQLEQAFKKMRKNEVT